MTKTLIAQEDGAPITWPQANAATVAALGSTNALSNCLITDLLTDAPTKASVSTEITTLRAKIDQIVAALQAAKILTP